jgi:hypothetical protein
VPSFDLICLANSYKHNRRCVAGLRADGGGWLRPVSEREKGELDYHQFRYPDRSEPRVLDVIRMGLSGPRPLPHHPENWLIDGSAWEPVQRPASKECYAKVIAGAISRDPLLFGSSGSRVPEEQFRRQAARESLVLVQPRDVCWYREPDGESSRNPTRVRFQLHHAGYDLPLTDPARRRLLAMEPPGSHSAEDLYIPQDRKLLLTINLSEPYSGFCYKLVAGVVVLPQAWDPLF